MTIACAGQNPLFLQAFITGLNALAKHNFPVPKVTAYLNTTPFQEDWLKPYMFFSEKKYTRNLLHKQPDYELLLLCWMPNQISPIHGHEGEKCWMRVEAGELYFTDYIETNGPNDIIVEPRHSQVGGRGFVDGPAFIHQVANRSFQPAMSLHLYARPFAQCDIFDQDKQMKKRVDLKYDSINGKSSNN